MNIPYEMFLTIQLIQLMHLTCRKDCVQSPKRKEGWDLFQRTCEWQFREIIQDEEKYDDNFKERKRSHTQCSYVTLLSDIIDAEPSSYEEIAKKKGKKSTSSRRMMSRMWYQDLKGSQ